MPFNIYKDIKDKSRMVDPVLYGQYFSYLIVLKSIVVMFFVNWCHNKGLESGFLLEQSFFEKSDERKPT